MPPRRKTPWDNRILGVYHAPPKACTQRCPHGTECFGRHHSDPHWYPCEQCTPPPRGRCRCAHERDEHHPACDHAACGCRWFRPEPEQEAA
jgi:hypothetical protein